MYLVVLINWCKKSSMFLTCIKPSFGLYELLCCNLDGYCGANIDLPAYIMKFLEYCKQGKNCSPEVPKSLAK